MRPVKFSKWERMAGAFVLVAVVGFFATILGVAVEKGWFETKIEFKTIVNSGDGVHPGTIVQMSGLRAGEVGKVDLRPDGKIELTIWILSRFADKVRSDSEVQLIRPFVIGERIVDISIGSPDLPIVEERQNLPAKDVMDLMTLLSGKKLGETLNSMTTMAGSLKTLLEAIFDPERTQSWIDVLDRIDPLLKNLNSMSLEVTKFSRQATKDERIGLVLGELAVTTRELNRFIPEFERNSPSLAKDLANLVTNLSAMTEQMKVLAPAFAEIAPELPRASRRALEALDESVVLIKAMQKSFFVRSGVKEVRDEEAARKPASKTVAESPTPSPNLGQDLEGSDKKPVSGPSMERENEGASAPSPRE